MCHRVASSLMNTFDTFLMGLSDHIYTGIFEMAIPRLMVPGFDEATGTIVGWILRKAQQGHLGRNMDFQSNCTEESKTCFELVLHQTIHEERHQLVRLAQGNQKFAVRQKPGLPGAHRMKGLRSANYARAWMQSNVSVTVHTGLCCGLKGQQGF